MVTSNDQLRAESSDKQKPSKPKSQKTPDKGAKTKVEPMIYIGPNLPGGLLSRFTVFRDGLPEYVSKLAEAQTEIKSMIVPVAKFPGSLARINKSGTIESSSFKKLSKREERK